MQVCLPHFRWLVVLTCYEMRHHPQLSVSKWRSICTCQIFQQFVGSVQIQIQIQIQTLVCYEMRHHPQLSVSKWRSVHSVDSTHVKFFKYTNTRKNIHKYKLSCYEMRPHPQLSVSKWRSICTCQIPQISDFHSSKFQILHLKCHRVKLLCLFSVIDFRFSGKFYKIIDQVKMKHCLSWTLSL